MRSFEEYWNECGDVYAMEVAEKVWDYQQSKVDELQKRVDAALKMLDQFYCEGNLDSLEKAEQALKGGE